MDLQIYRLSNQKVTIAFDQSGNLIELINKQTGHNYAGNSQIWRLFVQHSKRFDVEVTEGRTTPIIVGNGKDQLRIKYENLLCCECSVKITIELTVEIEDDNIKFGVALVNNQPDFIIRDFHYPVIHGIKIKEDQALITADHGGMRYDDPLCEIKKHHTLYLAPDHKFIQKKLNYPNDFAAMNNFMFASEVEGLYFGLHSNNIEFTDHNFRLYGELLDVSMVRFPNCNTGEEWQQNGYVISPYSGSWHIAANKYRSWTEKTWFKPHDIPNWIRTMTGWQRIIMKHQYGEIHYKFDELPQLRAHGQQANIDTLFMFGWQQGGHDNNYPEYTPDPELGSDDDMRIGIEDFNRNDGAVILYANGQLIDKESDYYKIKGKSLSIRDFYGNEMSDGYYFRGEGNFYYNFASRSFVHACPFCKEWEDVLKEVIDTAFENGCKGAFFDQLGRGSRVCWSEQHNHASPALTGGIQRAEQIKRLRRYARSKSPNMSLGIEILCDITAVQADFVHTSTGATETTNDWENTGEKPKSEYFIDLFRYIFPEIILTDREIRDDIDIQRRVNHTLLKGLRSDVEIYRCRRSIAETPIYQDYLGRANALRKRYGHLLLDGMYRDIDGFLSSNTEIDARCFVNGSRMAIVATQSHLNQAETKITVPGYRYIEHDGLNEFEVVVQGDNANISLGRDGLIVIVVEKE